MTAGKITIDGKDIRDYSLSALRDEYAYVFQDVFLFSHTVDSNIAFYDPEAPVEDVKEAAGNGTGRPIYRKLPDGYDTIVGERGLGLSGGQKQRLSVARALMKNAPVLILDDASSALDMVTEKKLLAAVKEKTPERTLLIAAHRVSSVADCDEIVYLQDGEIIERGSVEELAAENGRFAAVYRSRAPTAALTIPLTARRRTEMKRNTYYIDEKVEKEKVDVKLLKRFLKYIAPKKQAFKITVILLALSTLTALVPPLFIKAIVDKSFPTGIILCS